MSSKLRAYANGMPIGLDTCTELDRAVIIYDQTGLTPFDVEHLPEGFLEACLELAQWKQEAHHRQMTKSGVL